MGKKTKRKSKMVKNKKGDDAAHAFSSSSRINIGDVTFKEYDRRLEELEKLESWLSEERVLLQKEWEIIAFERDSMELQLNEEFEKGEELTAQVKELEQIVQSQKMSKAGNEFESEKQLKKTVTRLTEMESQLKQQTKELDALREGTVLNELQNDLSKTQTEKKNLENALYNEQKLRTTKLNEKDETIMYLMGELARLKQEQSLSNPRPLVR